jgi:hypothetical protein
VRFRGSGVICSDGPKCRLTKVPVCDRFRGRLARKPECLDVTQIGPDASAQPVARVARLSGNVRQPNHVLGNEVAAHKTERRPRAGEEWLAATKYDGVEVKSILINKTEVG